MNGHQELNCQIGGETIAYTEECFHCSSNPDKFSSSLLSKDQQPYCNKCFQNMFVADVNSGGSSPAPVFKKPPPAPPKPGKKPLILFSTLPTPYKSTISTASVIPSSAEQFNPPPSSPPPPPPPPLIDPVFSVPVNDDDELELPPPPPIVPENYPAVVNNSNPTVLPTPPSFGQNNISGRKTTPTPPYETDLDDIPSSSRTPSGAGRAGGLLSTETNGFRKTPSPTFLHSSQIIKSNNNFNGQPTPKPSSYLSTNNKNNFTGAAAVAKPIAQSSVLAAVQAEQEEEKLKKLAASGQTKVNFNRQPSEDQEESHLDQLNSIFKMTSMKQKPAVNLYDRDASESTSNQQGPRSSNNNNSAKPPIAANKPSFNCSKCRTNLLGKTVESKGGKVFCTPCYRIEVATQQQCVKCGDPFTPENHSVTYQNENYHVSCFRCDKCELPIGSKTFCKQTNGVFCSTCYFEVSGRICVKCNKYLTSTGFIFRNQPWHHACFVCAGECQKPLGDQEIFCKDDQPYCVNCFDKDLEKCEACKKPLVGETVEYEQKSYHDECFCCMECKAPIGSASFFPREGKVYCETCFSIKFGKTCKKCQLIISPSSGFGLVFRESHYHRNCFVCHHCLKSLAGIPVHSTKTSDDIFCGECYDTLFAKRCAGCQQIISGVIGSRFMSFHDKSYHVECFLCKNCHTSLENRKFAPTSQGEMLCIACSKFNSPYSQ